MWTNFAEMFLIKSAALCFGKHYIPFVKKLVIAVGFECAEHLFSTVSLSHLVCVCVYLCICAGIYMFKEIYIHTYIYTPVARSMCSDQIQVNDLPVRSVSYRYQGRWGVLVGRSPVPAFSSRPYVNVTLQQFAFNLPCANGVLRYFYLHWDLVV